MIQHPTSFVLSLTGLQWPAQPDYPDDGLHSPMVNKKITATNARRVAEGFLVVRIAERQTRRSQREQVMCPASVEKNFSERIASVTAI